MRPGRFFLILTAALSAAGCMHASVPDSVETSGALAVPPNLDSLAYGRRTPPSTAYAQAQQTQPPQAQPPVQARSQPSAPTLAPMQAHAQVVPVAAQPAFDPAYALDTGDKLRIVVFGQEGLSNSYFVDAAGQVTVPLIGPVGARGLTTQQLSRAIAAKLRAGFIREPHVAVEIETYRPFFILGEVIQPGQYPYVPNMTAETAVAIAGGFTPRAYRYDVSIDRQTPGASVRARSSVPLLTRVMPGDTIVIKERWF